MGQRSRSQHRFSLYGGITRIRGEALLLLKGNQRIVVINAPWYLLSSEPVSLPHLLQMARPDKRSPSSLSGSAVGESVVPLNVARAPISGLIRHLCVGQAYSAV